MESPPDSRSSPDVELLPTRPSLLARLRNQDDSAAWHRSWEEFYQLYHPVIYRHALKSGLRETEAEDVVQEIVVGVARKLPQFRYDPECCSFKTWLFRITRNKIVDQLRKRARQPHDQLPATSDTGTPADELVELTDDKTPGPDEELERLWKANLHRAAIEHVKQRVKPMTMRLYLYHVVDDHTVAETVAHFRAAAVTDAAVHQAKHRIQRMIDEALPRLRDGQLLA